MKKETFINFKSFVFFMSINGMIHLVDMLGVTHMGIKLAMIAELCIPMAYWLAGAGCYKGVIPSFIPAPKWSTSELTVNIFIFLFISCLMFFLEVHAFVQHKTFFAGSYSVVIACMTVFFCVRSFRVMPFHNFEELSNERS